ncbi:MAG: hypothetical protein ACN4GM_03805 [Gammaproteobacteria bacterium]
MKPNVSKGKLMMSNKHEKNRALLWPANGKMRRAVQRLAVVFSLMAVSGPAAYAAEDVILVEKDKVTINGDLEVTGAGVIPVGGIVMWSGDPQKLPEGWALCDGNRVEGVITPNLMGQFVVGYDPDDVDYRKVGKPKTNAGVRTSQHEHNVRAHSHGKGNLYIAKSGTHKHNIDGDGDGGGDNYRIDKWKSKNVHRRYDTWTAEHQHENVHFGGRVGNTKGVDGDMNQPTTTMKIDNRPPYYVLAFIMRIR